MTVSLLGERHLLALGARACSHAVQGVLGTCSRICHALGRLQDRDSLVTLVALFLAHCSRNPTHTHPINTATPRAVKGTEKLTGKKHGY